MLAEIAAGAHERLVGQLGADSKARKSKNETLRQKRSKQANLTAEAEERQLNLRLRLKSAKKERKILR